MYMLEPTEIQSREALNRTGLGTYSGPEAGLHYLQVTDRGHKRESRGEVSREVRMWVVGFYSTVSLTGLLQ